MHWSIELIEDKNYVKVMLTGAFDAGEHLRMVEDILAQKYWKSDMSVLIDSRNVSYLNVGIEVMRQASDNMAKFDAQIGSGKAAILMESLSSFGKGRQFEILADEKASANIRVFLDENQAIEWLDSKES